MIHELRLTIDDQIAQRYRPVPVPVPAGAGGLSVRLEVLDSEAVLDLGCEGPAGWRGWSGGARDRFVIGPRAATPGYLPGELESGTWNVILGLHQIPGAGVRVRLHTDVVDSPEVPPCPLAPVAPTGVRGSQRALPAEPGLTWYAGDFHAHTTHSDGSQSIDQMAARAAQAGLDFLAITDHNTVSHHPHLAAAGARHGVTLIPGQEVTTAEGHANAFGQIPWVDFRTAPHTWVPTVQDAGGILSINHPIDADCAWLHRLEQLPSALEVWHISWFRDLRATGPLALWQRWSPDLATPLGGGDFHRPEQGWTVGTPTTWVAASDPSTEAILQGVAAGRTSISVGVRPDATPDPLGAPVLIRIGEDLHADGAAGTTLVDGLGRRRRIRTDSERQTASPADAPFRLVDDQRRVVALTR